MSDYNFNYNYFTLFIDMNESLPISYDWKLETEKIKCPVSYEDEFESHGSQLYIREYQNPNSYWKKIDHPNISINNISKDGDVSYDNLSDRLPLLKNLKIMYDIENKNIIIQ